MKKSLLMLLGVFLALPVVARDFSYEYKGQTLTYTVLDEDAKTVETKAGDFFGDTPGNDVSGELIIPAKVTDGKDIFKVTAIGECAFQHCTSLTSIVIPEGITSISQRAFKSCYSLISVSLPEGITSISPWVFWNCYSLTSITIPESVTSIDDEAFSGCYGLTSISIPEGVTSIGQGVFSSCTSLTSISIPEGVTSIANLAFWDCTSLTSISIPEGVTSIGAWAFLDCTSLTSIVIPQGISSIGEFAFEGCDGLKSVYYVSDNPISITHINNIGATCNIFSWKTYENAILYMTEDGMMLGRYIEPWKNFKHVSLFDPAGIEEISADFDENAPCEIYNLSGVKVSDTIEGLTPGLYIVRQGNAVKKIEVR
ncbi:MAG: leucine-rich repeat domain-containing protein [Duncaniella sp.]|nr:leucine-rich repeat domain-containing protein [Duncaniella sp.]